MLVGVPSEPSPISPLFLETTSLLGSGQDWNVVVRLKTLTANFLFFV